MTEANEIELEFANLRYDITMPLVQGRMEIPGVRLKIASGRGEPDALKTGNFGVRDLNVGTWLPMIQAGWQLTGLPVFSKRKPVYEYIFCRTDRGIDSPKDLEGKRITANSWVVSTIVWVVGLLEHRYEVDRSKIQWVINREDEFKVNDPRRNWERAADPRKHPVDQLLDGDVDAIITDISDSKLFRRLENDDRVKRLFPDYEAEDYRLYQEAGIYTPAHLLVMSQELDRQHPELAGKLFQALEKSKEIAYDDILSDRAGFGVVNLRERLLEQQEKWGDPYKYGITANKADIDTFFQYNHELGTTRSLMKYDEAFAHGTLDT